MLQTGSGTGSLLNTIYHAAAGTSLALTARAERVDQIDKFTRHQVVVQRVLSVSSATVSIVFCLGAIYMFLAIDPRRLIFRHQLITFLLLFDLLKAIILLLYPTRVMTHFNSYYNDKFCQAVGFRTATAIEGADFAILAFAIHTFLLIFKPSLSVKTSNGVAGGLYRFRFYVYGLSFLIPLILASLAYSLYHFRFHYGSVCLYLLSCNTRIPYSWWSLHYHPSAANATWNSSGTQQ